MIKNLYKIALVAVIFCIVPCDARKGSLSFWGDNLAQYEPEIWTYVNQYGDARIVRSLIEEVHSERLQVQRLVGYAIVIAALRNDVSRLDAWLMAQRPGWDAYLGQALVGAAEMGHLEAVERLVQWPVNNAVVVNWNNGQALQAAVRNNRLSVVNFLLNNGATVGLQAAFANAAALGFNSIVERMMQIRALNVNWDNGRALRLAAENGHHSVVELLLTRRFSSNILNEALRVAARNGYWEIVGSLISVRDTERSPAGSIEGINTAFIEASNAAHPEIVELLIEHDADIHAQEDSALRGAVVRGDAFMVDLLIGSVEDRPEDIPPFDLQMLDTLIMQASALRSNPPEGRTEQDYTGIITTLRAYRHRVYEQEESEHPAKRRRCAISPY